MNYVQHIFVITIAISSGWLGYVIGWKRGAIRPKTKTNTWSGAVYIRCRDCKTEHAVYANGECHAVRDAAYEREQARVQRRPGIED